jgi:hypothetical protein
MRWKSVIIYQTTRGVLTVEHDQEELEELHDIVERGPDWNSILSITTVLQETTGRVTITGEAR